MKNLQNWWHLDPRWNGARPYHRCVKKEWLCRFRLTFDFQLQQFISDFVQLMSQFQIQFHVVYVLVICDCLDSNAFGERLRA